MSGLPITLAKGSPPHRAYQALGYGLLVGAAIFIAVTRDDFGLVNWQKVCAYSVAILGLNLVTGFSGQVSLGHSAFFGVGAYVTAILVDDFGWPFLATLPVGALFGLVLGFLLGLPALRLSGLYLALVTLALGFVFPVMVKLDVLEEKTGGSNGKPVAFDWEKPGWFGLDVSDAGWKFIVLASVAGLMFLLASNMIRSRVGRALQALRDNQIGAAVSGVYPAAWKTGAFSISAAYAAVAGGMLMFAVGIVSPESVGFVLAIQLITGLVLGGAGTISGNLVGGMALVFLPVFTAERTSNVSFLFIDPADSGLLANVLYGILLIAVVFVMPGGIIWFVRFVRAKLIRFVPTLPPASSGEPGDATAPTGHAVPAGARAAQEGGSA